MEYFFGNFFVTDVVNSMCLFPHVETTERNCVYLYIVLNVTVSVSPAVDCMCAL